MSMPMFVQQLQKSRGGVPAGPGGGKPWPCSPGGTASWAWGAPGTAVDWQRQPSCPGCHAPPVSGPCAAAAHPLVSLPHGRRGCLGFCSCRSSAQGRQHPQIARNSRKACSTPPGGNSVSYEDQWTAVGEKLQDREDKQPSLQPVWCRGVQCAWCRGNPSAYHTAVSSSMSLDAPVWTSGIRLWGQVQRLDEGGWRCNLCLRNSPRPCESRSCLSGSSTRT
jgi:hypothetical protein